MKVEDFHTTIMDEHHCRDKGWSWGRAFELCTAVEEKEEDEEGSNVGAGFTAGIK